MHRTVRSSKESWVIGLVVFAASSDLVLAQTAQLPSRKSGLWEVTVRSAGESAMRQQKVLQCTTEEAEQVMLLAVVPGQEHCHDVKAKRTTEGYEVRTQCYVHDNRVDASVNFSGDLQIAYRGVFEVTYSKPVRFNPGRTKFEGRWLGPCKAGQRAGDMVLPNGATVNVVEDRKRAENRGHEDHKH